MSRRPPFASFAILLAATVGCTGTISDSDRPSSAGQPSPRGNPGNPGPGSGPGAPAGGPAGGAAPGGPVPGGAMPGGAPPDPTAAGPLPLRRLTRREYNNTVRDLLGDATRLADDFPPDVRGDLLFPAAPLVDSLRASRLADAAATLAAAVDLTKVLPCTPSPASETDCVGQFIDKFGTRAYRRPVLPAERALLLGLYQDGRMKEALDFSGGIRLLIEAMVQSTGFLYHWEIGPEAPLREGKVVRLEPYQLASRLSYFLWGSMPDDELLAAAAANQLSTEAQVVQQARRLVADPRARESLTSFFDEWLALEELPGRSKDAKIYPEFSDGLKGAMTAELHALSSGVAFDSDGRLETLLTSTTALVSQPLAAIYGLKGVTGTTPQMVQLDPGERSGLLTRAGFQALFGDAQGSSPIKRGAEIYKRLLCGLVPEPPPNVPPPKPASAGGTTRSRFVEHGQNACATACHGLFDAIGFAFENYDGVGRFRTTDNGLPVDASGEVQLDGKSQAFKDGRQLSQLLAGSREVRQCFASQVAGFALGRSPGPGDLSSIDVAVAAYDRSPGTLRDLLVAFASSRTFRYRNSPEGVMP